MAQPPFVMSKYLSREDLMEDAAKYYKAECLRLRLALEGAHSGFGMAYEALKAQLYDEAMLHCGQHHKQTWEALLPHTEANGATGAQFDCRITQR